MGFMFTFLLGGITGVMLAAAPIDFQVHDSYFVVAHFHYVMFGGSVFALYAGVYHWFPKFTGRLLDERLGKVHFWLTLVGFHLTFFVQHILGLDGMPRRVADYREIDGFTGLNQISTAGSFLLGLSTLPFLWNVAQTLRGRLGSVAGDNPWEAHTLEWATTSPPPPENFVGPLPPIRSQRPVWDADHPERAIVGHGAGDAAGTGGSAGAPGGGRGLGAHDVPGGHDGVGDPGRADGIDDPGTDPPGGAQGGGS
jgi:cytochrome c oxidase subunit 1